MPHVPDSASVSGDPPTSPTTPQTPIKVLPDAPPGQSSPKRAWPARGGNKVAPTTKIAVAPAPAHGSGSGSVAVVHESSDESGAVSALPSSLTLDVSEVAAGIAPATPQPEIDSGALQSPPHVQELNATNLRHFEAVIANEEIQGDSEADESIESDTDSEDIQTENALAQILIGQRLPAPSEAAKSDVGKSDDYSSMVHNSNIPCTVSNSGGKVTLSFNLGSEKVLLHAKGYLDPANIEITAN